jgi:hypothetical protein
LAYLSRRISNVDLGLHIYLRYGNGGYRSMKSSCLLQRITYSATCISMVRQSASSGELALTSINGIVHFAASSGFLRMLVVVCRPRWGLSINQAAVLR